MQVRCSISHLNIAPLLIAATCLIVIRGINVLYFQTQQGVQVQLALPFKVLIFKLVAQIIGQTISASVASYIYVILILKDVWRSSGVGGGMNFKCCSDPLARPVMPRETGSIQS